MTTVDNVTASYDAIVNRLAAAQTIALAHMDMEALDVLSDDVLIVLGARKAELDNPDNPPPPLCQCIECHRWRYVHEVPLS